MKIGVVGCGAIGGFVAARLALAGETVTVLDLPPVREAVAARGLVLLEANGQAHTARGLAVAATGAEAGPQDAVLLGVKAHDLPDVAAQAGAMLRPDTAVVTLQNGVPWWYFQRHGGPWDGRHLQAADPDGRLARELPAGSVVGCVAYPAAATDAPGVVRHVEGDRFPLGELDGRESPRTAALAGAFQRAGLRARVLPDIRAEIWLKAVGAAAFNPLSALTRSTMAAIAELPATRALALVLMAEAQAVAEALGVTLRVSLAQRLAGAAAVGHHKTSMLQDIEAGRRTELAALVGTVLEIGEWTGVATPALATIHACVQGLEAARGTGPRPAAFPR